MKLSLLIYVFLTSFFVFSQTPDPGLPGSYAVSTGEYDFGDLAFDAPTFFANIEVIASVHYPTDLTDAPFPVLVLLHGRHSTCYSGGGTSIDWPCEGSFDPIPSYQGYDYLAEQMASHGYIVISVSANSISSTDNFADDSGMRARGELVQYHLDLWNDWNTSGGDPFGGIFLGKLNMDKIGTMGHSRGGEGVIEHALYNRELGSPYGIQAVLTLAPVDFNRPILNGIPIMNIAPYCDGDVSDLQGVHFYDDARYNDESDTTAKHNLLMLGANHNYYNTVWTPGEFPAGTGDDWGFVDFAQVDDHCGTTALGNKRFTPEKQRNSLLTYASAFFRVYVGGENEFDPILKVEDIIPPASSTLIGDEIFMSYHPPMQTRVDINRLEEEDREELNSITDSASSNGLLVYDICGDDFGEQYCIGSSAGASQEPHNKNGGASVLGLSQLEIQWNSPDDWYKNNIPSYLSDFAVYEALQFRAAVNFDTSPSDIALDFSVELTDNTGATAEVNITDYSNALFFPPGDFGGVVPRTMHNTISVPIADFNTIDLSNIAFVKFLFDESVAGAILISDLTLSAGDLIAFEPIADFESNAIWTCSGEINFIDNSIFTPTEWLWDFGDSFTSTEQNPSHTYANDGLYDVTLTVTNEIGASSVTELGYIVVDKPAPPVGINDSICGEGDVTLNVVDEGSIYNWYDAEDGGTLLATGAVLADNISATTEYFVEEVIESPLLSVGPVDNSFGSGGFFNANDFRGIFFNVSVPLIIESVKVYADGDGFRTIQVLDGDGGTVVQSTTVSIPNGESTVLLNFDLLPQDGYYMKVTGGLVDLFRINDASPTYPYEIPGVISLTGSNVSGSELEFYYYFFNWKVREPSCVSERIEVTGFVEESFDVVTSDDITIVGGTSTEITASGGTNYLWSPTTGLSDPSAANTTASPTETTTYMVTVSDDAGCVSTGEVTVTINGFIGMNENFENTFEIYPNPSTGIVYVTTNNTEPLFLTVYAADGKKVYDTPISEGENGHKVDLSQMEKGVYYFKMFNAHSQSQQKIVLH